MMKNMVFPLAAACFVFFQPLFAQIPCSKVPIPCERYKLNDVDLQELTNLEKENAHAIQLHNPTFFQSAYTDGFTGFTWYGEPITKTKLIQLIQNSDVNYNSVAASDIRVQLYVDSASVLSLRTERAIIKGKRVDRQFRTLRIYVQTPRGWKITSQLETQLPSALQQR
jgi:Domain of unknown function (DUF4440)